jgi:hypothetical protein
MDASESAHAARAARLTFAHGYAPTKRIHDTFGPPVEESGMIPVWRIHPPLALRRHRIRSRDANHLIAILERETSLGANPSCA